MMLCNKSRDLGAHMLALMLCDYVRVRVTRRCHFALTAVVYARYPEHLRVSSGDSLGTRVS